MLNLLETTQSFEKYTYKPVGNDAVVSNIRIYPGS